MRYAGARSRMVDPDVTGPLPDPGDVRAADAVERGQLFGKYVILEPLGEGGAGQVYAAYDPHLERRVAIKMLKREGEDPDDQEGADAAWAVTVREARVVARLAHPNVVVVHETGIHDDVPFIVTELVEGQDLSAWLRSRSPSVASLLPVFEAAGRGLAAAHAAGIIHGDFKPSNVLMGSDGRPRVADFGVARLTGAERTRERGPVSGAVTQDADTGTFRVVGTPYYMAPEQFEGEAADAASDQYAFCLALIEALLGEKLLKATTIEALAAAKHEPHRIPGNTGRIPRGLWRALRRGISVDPQRRHPSMPALLDALEGERRRRRVVRTAGLGVLLSAGGTALGYGVWGEAKPAQACSGSSRHLDGVWDGARAEAIGAAMTATHEQLSATTWPRARESLDGYAQRWVEEHTAACEASAFAEQSETVLQARMSCLEDRLDALDSVAGALQSATMDAVIRAVAAADGLPSLNACADASSVSVLFESTDSEDPAAVDALRRSAREVDAQLAVANYDAARAELEPSLARAIEEGLRSSEAELRVRAATLENALGNVEPALRHIEDAGVLAMSLGRDATAISALLLHVNLLAVSQKDGDEALLWARWAEALVDRSDDRPKTKAALLAARGSVHARRGELTQARDLLQQAVAILSKSTGPDSFDVAKVEMRLGELLRDLGDSAAAVEMLQRVREIYARELGPAHPDIGGALNLLGTAQADMGEMELARASIREGMDIVLAAWGPDHPGVAMVENNLAMLAQALGDIDEARRGMLDVLRIQRLRLGAEHPALALTLSNLASLELNSGHTETGLTYLLEAETIQRATDGERHIGMVSILENKALALGYLRRFDEARATAERGREIGEAVLPEGHPMRVGAVQRLAWVMAQQEDNDAAITTYDRVVEMLDKSEQPDALGAALWERGHVHMKTKRFADAVKDLTRAEALLRPRAGGMAHAETCFDLAQSLWARGEHDRARDFAAQAVAGLQRSGPAERHEAAVAWVAAHSDDPTAGSDGTERAP